MNNLNKPSLTIGIPAHNEERNIANLAENILKQKNKFYKLSRILIICDGCTDKTVQIVKDLSIRYRQIRLIERNIRSGKASALNLIYEKSNTDFLMTIDADVAFIGNRNIDLLISTMLNNPQLNLTGPRHIPAPSKTIFGNFARVSYQSFEDAFLKINQGNNFYSVMTVEMMKKSFYKSFVFPQGTVSDQCFVYAKSIEKNKNGFQLVTEAKVMFGTAKTFQDWRILSARSVTGDKADVLKHFGDWILDYYSMPKEIYFRSLVRWLFKNPFYLIGALIMNIYIRQFPYKKNLVKNGIWELVSSSKELIYVN
jgi:glycosyltransferase involved in cell wall biosynthesis